MFRKNLILNKWVSFSVGRYRTSQLSCWWKYILSLSLSLSPFTSLLLSLSFIFLYPTLLLSLSFIFLYPTLLLNISYLSFSLLHKPTQTFFFSLSLTHPHKPFHSLSFSLSKAPSLSLSLSLLRRNSEWAFSFCICCSSEVENSFGKRRHYAEIHQALLSQFSLLVEFFNGKEQVKNKGSSRWIPPQVFRTKESPWM